jgi:Tol biopolymer transport system component
MCESGRLTLKGGTVLLRVFVFVVIVVLALCSSVAAESFDFYRSGPNAVGLFNNLTGSEVDGLLLRFSGPIEPRNAVGIGGDLLLDSNENGELQYSGFVVPNGTWEVDWAWEGPRLEYAAWLRDGAVVEEIPVHNPTATFGMMSVALQTVRFFAPGSADPDGLPLARYLWRWSDGAEAEGVFVERAFNPGEYEVTLTVWDVDGNQASRTRQFEILEPQYTLTINIAGQGAVVVQPYQAVYFNGDKVTLTATPAEHWDFIGWSGDLTGMDAQQTIAITGNTSVTANFDWHDYMFTITTVGDGAVTATPNQTGYHYGTVVTLDPEADEDWEFAGWSGDLTGTDDPASITITADTSVTASFEELLRAALRIAFQDAGVGGAWDIFVVTEDGTGLQNLTQNSAEDKYPTWSPNGEWVAFSSTRDGRPWRPYIVSSDGVSVRLLVDMEAIDIGWGTNDILGFVNAGDDGFGNIWTIHADGTQLTQVTSGIPFYGLTMAPDGTRMSGVAPYASPTTLYAMNADGTGLRHYGPPSADGTSYGMAWSPDSRYVAYTSATSLEIYDFNTDTSRVVLTTSDIGVPYFLVSSRPDWDPTGQRLVFEAGSASGYYDVWTVNTDGTSPTRITTEPLRESSTGWSPDGDELLYVHQSSPAGFRVVDAETGAIHYQYPMVAPEIWYRTYPMWEGQSQ